MRVDNRRQPTDLPPSRVTITGAPSGGWWNYGGLLGDVYLRRINRLDFGTVGVRPILDSRTGARAHPVHGPDRELRQEGVARQRDVELRLRDDRPRQAEDQPGAGEDVHRHARHSDAAPVVAGRPVPLSGEDRGEEERPHVRGLRPVERDQIDQGRQRPAAAQRPAGQPARRLRAPGRAERRRRGHPGDGAGDDRPAQGRRRDAAAHALPVQPADARDGRPRRRLPVVGDPRLPGADGGPQEEGRHGRGRVAAQGEHHRVREPPVGPDVVARQRARAGADERRAQVVRPRRADRQDARPDAARVAGDPGLPGPGLPVRLPGDPAARRQRLLRLVSRAGRLDRRRGPAAELPRQRARLLPDEGDHDHRGRRRGEPRRARSRSAAPTSSSPTSSPTTSASTRPSRGCRARSRCCRTSGAGRAGPAATRCRSRRSTRRASTTWPAIRNRRRRWCPTGSTRRSSTTYRDRHEVARARDSDPARRRAGGVRRLLPGRAGRRPVRRHRQPRRRVAGPRRRWRRDLHEERSRLRQPARGREPAPGAAARRRPGRAPRRSRAWRRRTAAARSPSGSTTTRSTPPCARPARAPWGAPQLIYDGTADGAQPATRPSLSMSTHGAGYVAFQVGGDVRAAHMPAGSTSFTLLDTPLDVDPNRVASAPDIAASADGTAVASFTETGGDGIGHVYVRRVVRTQLSQVPREAGVTNIDGFAGGSADSSQVDVEDDSSYAWVVFRQDIGGVSRILARHLVGSNLQPAITVDGNASPGEQPSFDMTGKGRGLLGLGISGANQVYGTPLNAGDKWGGASQLGGVSGAPARRCRGDRRERARLGRLALAAGRRAAVGRRALLERARLERCRDAVRSPVRRPRRRSRPVRRGRRRRQRRDRLRAGPGRPAPDRHRGLRQGAARGRRQQPQHLDDRPAPVVQLVEDRGLVGRGHLPARHRRRADGHPDAARSGTRSPICPTARTSGTSSRSTRAARRPSAPTAPSASTRRSRSPI